MKKILLIILIIVCLVGNAHANIKPIIESIIGQEHVEITNSTTYHKFLSKISKLQSWNECEAMCQTIFKKDSDKLIIGCSPVVFLGRYGKDALKNKRYDLIGFGGTKDNHILSWLSKLNKSYNTIVIWGCVNDIFDYKMQNKSLIEDGIYLNTLDSLFTEARRHLNNGPKGKIIFMNVKEMTSNEGLPVDYIEDYNRIAKQINIYIKNMYNVITVDVAPSTDENNSEWYLHYTNSDAFVKILNDIQEAM